MERNTEAKAHLNAAFNWLRKIYVNDVNVDYMGMARQELRAVLAALNKEEEEQTEVNDNA